MNTPTHYIVNLVLLGKTIAPNQTIAITVGAILPDVPIFIFYGITKFIYQLPDQQIWGKAYYDPFWQTLIAIVHSFPLAAIALLLCLWWQWDAGAMACLSMICHSLLDVPVHHEDAHRHFFPFSDYRFVSPISYWDPAHYGQWVALVEVVGVLAITPLALGLLQSAVSKFLVVGINGFYLFAYCRFYL